jgi:hypothetical protein
MAYTTVGGKLVKVKKVKSAVRGDWPPAPSIQPREEQAPRLAKDKGEYGGSCNITRCQRPNSATWFNHSTRKYYCPSCARTLNFDHFNRKDAMEMWGHFLCTEGEVIEGNDYQAVHDHYRKLHEEKYNAAANPA